MGKTKSRSVDRVMRLAKDLNDFVLGEVLDRKATYEDALLALGIAPGLLRAASQELPSRCFSDPMTVWCKASLDRAAAKHKKKA